MNMNEKKWEFCPSCGSKLPVIEKQKFCIRCGINLEYIKSNVVSTQISSVDIKTYPYRKDLQSKKISDEEILNPGKKQLWSSFSSIGIPLAAFILMNLLALGISLLILPLIMNFEDLNNLILNPYFTIILSFAELIFILIPVLFVRKYLQNPSFNNRLRLLGFTFKGYDNLKVIKEIFIGLGFAVSGIFLVGIVSLFMQITLELIFGVEIDSSVGGSLNEIDSILTNSDILALILLALTMILIIATSEEILFRGFMQKGLVRSVGKKGGIIITAIVFSLIHVIGIFFVSYNKPITYAISFLLNFFPYLAISLLLGILFYWRKENLIAVIITHGFYNAITIVIAYIFLSF